MLNFLRHSPALQQPQGRAAGKSYGPGKRDALTGAVNRSTFQKMVEDALAGEHKQGCLLLVDVDHMQEVNDNYGRETGDRVLQAVYATLREHFRGEDGIGRLSEDTFGVWIDGLSAEQVSGIRRRIAVVNDRLLHGDQDIPTVTLSAGAALGESGESYKEMYRQAQKVLHRVKEGGRCGCEIYTI
ncbi:MAG: GGDEF domain-containing protein [Lachnospiraceae bacterium]|nr:GGDEF domain-containing protein [Lachnospiraceae bacterium]